MQQKVRKEYMYYDFLEHAFNVKYLLNNYEVNNNHIIIKLSFREFLNYYDEVLNVLLTDDVVVDFLDYNNLLEKLSYYSLYSVTKEADDYYIYLEQYEPYHLINKDKLSLKEQLAFYDLNALKSLGYNRLTRKRVG